MTSAGAIILSVFGAIWWIAGARASGHGSPLMYGVAMAAAGGIVFAALRSPSGEVEAGEKQRRGRLLAIASGAEGVAIFVAVNVLANLGLRDYMAPAIAVIVGLHFLPLARRLPAPLYYATAAVLVALGGAGVLIRDPRERMLVVSAGAAVILWITSVAVLLRTPGPDTRADRTG